MLEYLGDIYFILFYGFYGTSFLFLCIHLRVFLPKDLVISRIAFFIGCVVRSRLSKTLTRLDIVDN